MLFGGGLLDYVFFSSGEVKETIQGKNRAAEARYMSKTVEKGTNGGFGSSLASMLLRSSLERVYFPPKPSTFPG